MPDVVDARMYELIGEMRADIRNLKEAMESSESNLAQSIQENRKIANERHQENRERLDALETAALRTQATIMAVDAMKPIVDGFQQSKLKMAGAVSVVSMLFMFMGYAISAVLGSAFQWALSLIKIKIG